MKKCPLCDKILLEITDLAEEENGTDYICQTRVSIPGCKSLSHYEDRSGGRRIIWIAYPYRITNYTDNQTSYIEIHDRVAEEKEIEVLRTVENVLLPNPVRVHAIWKEVATVPILHPDSSEKLSKRIKLLVTFL